MKMLMLAFVLLTTSAWANLHLAPPDFAWEGGRAIFVDFQKAEYDVTYDLRWKRTSVKSRITFIAKGKGQPIFDLVPNPTNVRLNGEPVEVVSATAPDGSRIRIVDATVTSGEHVLEMEHRMKKNVRYSWIFQRASSAFWIRDLKERLFMEQYIPANFEFDQYAMIMNVNFKGTRKVKQDIFANGVVTQTSPRSYRIEFPAYFTSSSPYFHTTPRGHLRRIDFDYTSISGRAIPFTIYSPWYLKTSKFANYAKEVMAELEADYGPWAHPSFIAYGTLPGTGGMEHAGATQTSLGALDHEMLHSYFAKGVMPANGNSGWIDEAIASWRDYGYQRLPTPGYGGSNIGGQSVYKRNTDNRSYALGRAFMAYLDWRLQDVGGLKAFLRGYFAAYKHTVVTTEHFKNNLEFFSGIDFTEDFNTYIWGENSTDTEDLHEESHVHKELTAEQLDSLL